MSKVYEKSLEMLKGMLEQIFEPGEVEVVLFGSRAKGSHLETSDIDLGILPQRKINERKLTLLRERLEDSNIPYKVDVVDLSQTSKKFVWEVLKEGVVIWKG